MRRGKLLESGRSLLRLTRKSNRSLWFVLERCPKQTEHLNYQLTLPSLPDTDLLGKAVLGKAVKATQVSNPVLLSTVLQVDGKETKGGGLTALHQVLLRTPWLPPPCHRCPAIAVQMWLPRESPVLPMSFFSQ